MLAALLMVSCVQTPSAFVTPETAPETPELAPTAVPVVATTAPTAWPEPTATSIAAPDHVAHREVAVTATDLAITADSVQLFPVPKIISGDRVTFQVQPYVPEDITVEHVSVDIYVDGQIVSSGTLDWRNWQGSAQGVYEWVWDTTGRPGQHEIRVVLDAEDVIREGDEDGTNNEVVFSTKVARAGERPLEERDISWYTEEIDCCVVHVPNRSAAFRDLPDLIARLDAAVSEVSARLDEFPERKFDVYFIERTIGQGGYAGTDMVVVYNDRLYIGGALDELLKHEAVHILDRQFAPQRIKLLAEGVAVWAAGGHYEPQDLQRRMAALIRLNEYIPLAELTADFYPAQHEIGYLEAGAFVDYLVGQYGWLKVREFYEDTAAGIGATEVEALDENLRRHFGLSLAEMEANWLKKLQSLTPSEEDVADLSTTIRYFEIARHYQLDHDPAAYFRTAWLPDPGDVISQGNPADFMRYPRSELNISMEVMLRAAYEAIREHDFRRATVLLDSIERFLEQHGDSTDPLVASYQAIVKTAIAFGYEPQRVALDGGTAKVLATTASGNTLTQLDVELRRGDWILLAN